MYHPPEDAREARQRWSGSFWNELAVQGPALTRISDEGGFCGWRIRLEWLRDDGGMLRLHRLRPARPGSWGSRDRRLPVAVDEDPMHTADIIAGLVKLSDHP